jgi:molybdopterin molybdotransferase
MPEFLRLSTPDQALQALLVSLTTCLPSEQVATTHALGRVTAQAVVAPHALPPFTRSSVDGFAVRASDTYGASDSLPAYLTLVGEISMGVNPTMTLSPAQCALIHTGGMLPENADAVVMVEHTQLTRPGEVEILRTVAVGENVLVLGEDVKEGEVVIPVGTRLRPAEIGGLMALGMTQVLVTRKPRLGIISSGDEVVPPEADPNPGQVRDVNSYALAALMIDTGAVPVLYGITPDRADALQAIAEQALAECDGVVITAGSSVSTRDLTAEVINALGKPGVLVHGVNVRPGKPTILANCNGKAVIGLPGNPVSALVIAGLFIVPVVESLLGLRRSNPRPSVTACLAVNVASQTGREEWVPVRLTHTGEEYIADPVFGKSNLIFTLVRANGLVRIPPDATGLSAGERVEVRLF